MRAKKSIKAELVKAGILPHLLSAKHDRWILPATIKSFDQMRGILAEEISVVMRDCFLRGQLGMDAVAAERQDYAATDKIFKRLGLKRPRRSSTPQEEKP